jgi:hypothetical protein
MWIIGQIYKERLLGMEGYLPKIIVVLTDFHGYKVPQASPEWIDRYFKLKKEGRNNG